MSRQGVLTRCLALGRLAADSSVPTRLQGGSQALRACASIASHPNSTSSSSSSAQGSGRWAAVAAATAGAAAAASLLLPAPWQAECAAGAGTAYPASEPAAPRSWLGLRGWLTGWIPLWGSGSREGESGLESAYLQAIKEDPRVAIVMAFALPFLSLSFGFTPSQADMEAAGAAVEPHVAQLRPWEVAVLMWGAARLGYAPGPRLLSQLQQRAGSILRAPPGSPEAFSPQEACMAVWALSALQAQTPELWQLEMAFVAGCPPDALDEVALLHLWQAGMFADRAVVTSRAPSLGSASAIVPRMRSAADEARATLAAGHLPLPLITRCEQAYRAASGQAGFDGPYLIELTMLRLLVTIYQELGDSVAYAPFFEDLQLADLQHARQLLADPYLLAKFKGEIAEKRARQNNFTRTLADVSRTLRGMGLHHTVQAPVEDGLVSVDIALPDFKIALFLEAPIGPQGNHTGSSSRGSSNGSGLGVGGGRLSTLDGEGTMLSGYVADETRGTKHAKLRMLQQRGWVVLPLTWPDNIGGEAEKRRVLLEQLDRAGQQQLMRGRVSSMLHGAMRTAEESKLGAERYGDRGSAGQYITRGQRQQ